jgi:hypothetical protein
VPFKEPENGDELALRFKQTSTWKRGYTPAERTNMTGVSKHMLFSHCEGFILGEIGSPT